MFDSRHLPVSIHCSRLAPRRLVVFQLPNLYNAPLTRNIFQRRDTIHSQHLADAEPDTSVSSHLEKEENASLDGFLRVEELKESDMLFA
jgi:hypothetical protein